MVAAAAVVNDGNGANLHTTVIEDSSIYKEIDISDNKELTDEEKDKIAAKFLREIYDYANERDISADKKLMLTNYRLQKHPKIQEH